MSERITPSEVRSLFGYDAGNLYWLERPALGKAWNTKHAGWIAGTTDPRGYVSILINRRAYKAHRLVWAFFHNEWPKLVDHIDGNPSNNRISNLRSVTHAENLRNVRAKADKPQGVRPKNNKWEARIRANGKEQYLGVFDTESAAIQARKAAALSFGYHENHGASR